MKSFALEIVLAISSSKIGGWKDEPLKTTQAWREELGFDSGRLTLGQELLTVHFFHSPIL